jgi:hypothetical protein
MAIDLSPEGLARMRANSLNFSIGGWDDETVFALIDALEEARALNRELDAALEAALSETRLKP